MQDYYLAQMCRKNRGDWDDFRAHIYDAYNAANQGDIVDMPWGERALLVEKQRGAVYLDGDYTEDELDDGANLTEAVKYVFYTKGGVYHTQFYMGDMYMYDYPTINEYHTGAHYDIDPNAYEIGGYYESSEPEPDTDTVKKWIEYFNQ